MAIRSDVTELFAQESLSSSDGMSIVQAEARDNRFGDGEAHRITEPNSNFGDLEEGEDFLLDPQGEPYWGSE
jgi:hypothetical protein